MLMDDLFRWKPLLKALVLPPTGPLLLALLGLALAGRHRRLGRMLATLGVVALLLLSLPAVAALLIRFVDDSQPLDIARAASAQAVVILGGGIRHDAPEYGGDTLGRLTLERVRYGARVARQTRLPVMVVGGPGPSAHETEAALMKAALESEYGVPVRWVEDRSQNTHENAQMAAAILRPDGVRKIVLVAHGFDMPRATAEFAAAGTEAIPAPTGIAGSRRGILLDYVPSAEGLQGSYYALYELLANAVRRFVVLTQRA
jgi:uncharacterized SAM-binding protein YcdF (DUF218 family)